MREASKSYRRVEADEVEVILLQGGRAEILPELSEELAAFSHRLLVRPGIEIRLGTRIRGATAETAILSDGHTVPCRTLIAAVGTGAKTPC